MKLRLSPMCTQAAASAIALLAVFVGRLFGAEGCVGAQAAVRDLRVLATFATGQSNLKYELVLGPCSSGPCPWSVRLVRDSKVIQTDKLEWTAPSNAVQLQPVDAGWGVGDGLGRPAGLKGWTAAIEDSGDGVVARPVKLTPTMIGLLVSQRTGVEPVKRWHALFIAEDSRLERAWTYEDVAGPDWSTTDVIPLAGDRQQVLYIDVYASGSEGSGDRPDRLEVQSLHWDEKRHVLAVTPAGEKAALHIIWFGPFPTPAAASAAKSNQSCLYNFYILDAGKYTGLPRGYVIGTVTSEPNFAPAADTEIAKCLASNRAHTSPYGLRR